ncbi:GTPase IMAP family member 7-like [Micropterus salmoides]|uniref:GTPase IMAP family member 7-like n=1 Tax=Micropterus salmoides TaxID=27706 RepID=UPI0018EA8372|nr:GTPase IMAP family member 7-like [Micropterus salmoides]
MALLVVENGLNGEEVLKQLEKLKETTGKPTEEFRVVLPLSYKPPYNFYTTEQVFSELSKLTADRNLMPANKRHADNPELYVSTPNTAVEKTGNANDITEGKKSLKTGKSSGTEVTLVLLGMAGTGKSASGNTILGKKQFRSRASSNPTTTECQVAETEIDGTRVRVIDTPDIFDDEIESSVKDEHVKKCKELCQSGPCVYLLVMQISRFSDSERNILKKLETAFGNNVQEQTVILFTRVDDLQRAKMSLQTFSRSCQTDLREIIKKCGNRCVVFENSGSDSGQVKKLMQTVDKMLEEQKQSYKCAAV